MFESAYASKTCVHGVEVCEVKAKRLWLLSSGSQKV